MKNFKCLIGIHSYCEIGTQSSKNLIDSWSGSPFIRNVKKCNNCCKIKYAYLIIGVDITANAFNWTPKLNDMINKNNN